MDNGTLVFMKVLVKQYKKLTKEEIATKMMIDSNYDPDNDENIEHYYAEELIQPSKISCVGESIENEAVITVDGYCIILAVSMKAFLNELNRLFEVVIVN
jgi:hypothetical protein